MNYYEPPDDPTSTVFDPSDDSFGPIMAAIQRGDFREAAQMLLYLEDPYDEPLGAGADPYGRPDPQTHPEYWTE